MASDDVLKRAGKFLIDRTDDMDAWYMVGDLAAEVRELRKGREILVKIHAAWTYPPTNGGASIGALLDEVAEHIEPGVFDAAMGATENG